MDFLDFCQTIKEVFQQSTFKFTASQSKINTYFLDEVDNLSLDNTKDDLFKMTELSILFEGFYQHLLDGALKKTLVELRAKRWEHHFGTPTVTFLLTYKTHIDQAIKLFQKLPNSNEPLFTDSWLINKNKAFIPDPENVVLIDPNCFNRVEMPHSKETTGIFVKTHNPFGGFTTTPCDSVSQQFIEHAASVAQTGGRILEIGAAFGAATLEALDKGVTVFCNDIEPENLAVVRNRYIETSENGTERSATGDSDKLILIPGALPDELIGLPKESFDAILICRVLHFFTGEKIVESLALLSTLLAPNGKIYIVCETPFLKNWQPFIPEFNKRIAENVEWPGEITNPAEFENSGRAASLPKFVHWITKEVLDRSLSKANFTIESSAYINRAGQFPDDLLLPEYGKESIGAIGVKRSF